MLTRRGTFGVLAGLVAAPLVVKADILMPLRGVKLSRYFEPFYLNNEQCASMIEDRIIEIANQVLDTAYGPAELPLSRALMINMLEERARWCSDLVSTKEVMFEEILSITPTGQFHKWPEPGAKLLRYDYPNFQAYEASRRRIKNNPVAVTGAPTKGQRTAHT